MMLEALTAIAHLRPAGDIDTAKNTRALVKQMETLALAALEGRTSRREVALRRIAGMTEIEADFDGFEAREIARAALTSERGDQTYE